MSLGSVGSLPHYRIWTLRLSLKGSAPSRADVACVSSAPSCWAPLARPQKLRIFPACQEAQHGTGLKSWAGKLGRQQLAGSLLSP